jgi:DNA-directed RNA polymerase specialized sigma24 family protein
MGDFDTAGLTSAGMHFIIAIAIIAIITIIAIVFGCSVHVRIDCRRTELSIEEGGDGKKPYDKKTFLRRIPKLLGRLRAVALKKARNPHIADDAVQMAVVNLLVKFETSPDFAINDSYALNAASRAVHELRRSESRRAAHETACGMQKSDASVSGTDAEAMLNEAYRNAEAKKKAPEPQA